MHTYRILPDEEDFLAVQVGSAGMGNPLARGHRGVSSSAVLSVDLELSARLSGCAGWLCRAQPWPHATCVPGCAGWLGCARFGRLWHRVFLEQQSPLCAGQAGRKSCPWEGGG